jgi:O-antigen ligase
MSGSIGHQERDGAIMLVILVVLTVAAALAAVRFARTESEGADRLSFAGRLPVLAAAAVALTVVGLVIGGLGEKADRGSKRLSSASAARLTTTSSQRYDFWRIGLDAFVDEPLTGVGAGGFRAEWLRERPLNVAVRNVHSLELGMATELGLPGLLAILVVIGGVLVAGRRALRSRQPLAAGCCAASAVWLLHATIDWDWELPAVTLPVIIMAGALIAASERRSPEPSPSGGSPSRRDLVAAGQGRV